MIKAEDLAQMFHKAYEELAPKFGYETNPNSRKEWKEVPEQNRLLMIATAEKILEAMPHLLAGYEVKNVGPVKNGDVVVVRYVNGIPENDTRKKDYIAIRDYFQRSGLQVRLLGISGDMTMDKVNELEMAQFGWFKRR